MTVPTTIDAGAWLGKYLEGPDGDLARAMLGAFADALMSAQASMMCNVGYNERTDERVNQLNGKRTRRWDTRVGSIDLGGHLRPGMVIYRHYSLIRIPSILRRNVPARPGTWERLWSEP